MDSIPVKFRAGDFVSWTETEAPASTTAICVYLRTNASSGAALDAVASGDGWLFELQPLVSGQLLGGEYLAQFVATVEGKPISYRETGFTVLPSLVYSGPLSAIDIRSPTRIRLDNVEKAIDVLTTKAQEYQIGIGQSGRRVRRADLPELIEWRDRLKAELRNEERAAAIASGQGDPNTLYTRFTPSY